MVPLVVIISNRPRPAIARKSVLVASRRHRPGPHRVDIAPRPIHEDLDGRESGSAIARRTPESALPHLDAPTTSTHVPGLARRIERMIDETPIIDPHTHLRCDQPIAPT